MKDPLIVVAAVISQGNTVLACRRKPDKAAGGFWEFPGGKVEAGESLASALSREIREESGIRINVGAELCRADTLVGSRVIRLICFWSTLQHEPPVKSVDHDLLRWVETSDLHSLEWAKPDLPAVARLVVLTRD